MILTVDHVYLAPAIDGQCPRTGELARLAARPAPATERFALRRKLLHALVAVLDNIQHAGRLIESQVIGIIQLSRLLAGNAPAAHQLAVARENLNAVVAGVRDIQVAVRSQRQRHESG